MGEHIQYRTQIPEIHNIICYVRRSRQDVERERKTGEDTLANQRRLMNRVLGEYNTPYEMVEEIGSGDKIEARPVFQNVLRWLRQGKYNAVAVKEIPRLGRGQYKDMGEIWDVLYAQRILIITPYKIYDLDNTMDARQVRFELFFAREEYETIKERMVSGKVTQAYQGKCMIVPPYGYTTNDILDWVINEEEAKWVRLIYEWFLYGLPQPGGGRKEIGMRGIATYLDELDVKVPYAKSSKSGKWNANTIRRILESDVYIGTMRYRETKKVGNKYIERPDKDKIILEDNHPSIINREIWELTQKKRKYVHTLHIARDFSPSELAGIVFCANCGHRMTRCQHDWSKTLKSGKISKYSGTYLRCRNKGCPTGQVKYNAVEKSILEGLKVLGSLNEADYIAAYHEFFSQQIKLQNTVDTQERLDKKKKELQDESSIKI